MGCPPDILQTFTHTSVVPKERKPPQAGGRHDSLQRMAPTALLIGGTPAGVTKQFLKRRTRVRLPTRIGGLGGPADRNSNVTLNSLQHPWSIASRPAVHAYVDFANQRAAVFLRAEHQDVTGSRLLTVPPHRRIRGRLGLCDIKPCAARNTVDMRGALSACSKYGLGGAKAGTQVSGETCTRFQGKRHNEKPLKPRQCQDRGSSQRHLSHQALAEELAPTLTALANTFATT